MILVLAGVTAVWACLYVSGFSYLTSAWTSDEFQFCRYLAADGFSTRVLVTRDEPRCVAVAQF
jgi:hypothetical protein